MAISKTDICNRALALAGASPIVNITEESTNANVLNRVYEMCLRSVLYECKWNFATKRDNLTVSADTLDFYEAGRNIVYVKPTDMIRIYETNPDYAQWKEEGDYIISDCVGLGVLYVYYLDVPSKYPSYFIDALVDKIVSEIAYQIVNSSTLAEKYTKKYEDISLPKATSANSQTGDQQYLKDDAWELAKYTNIQVES